MNERRLGDQMRAGLMIGTKGWEYVIKLACVVFKRAEVHFDMLALPYSHHIPI